MSLPRSLPVLAAALLLSAPACAQMAVTADLGTSGAGVHLVVPMEKDLNGRFGINAYSRATDKSVSDVDYRLTSSLKSIDILFDWYLLNHSNFHLTAGLVHNSNEFKGVGKPLANGIYVINGHPYEPATVGTLSADVSFRRAAPYLGIGWGNPLAGNSNWSFMGDVGAFYQGRPRTILFSQGCTVSNAVCTLLAKDVAVEQGQFDKDLSAFKLYPVLRASLAYRF